MKTVEVEMKWYDFDEGDMSDEDLDPDSGSRRFAKRQSDEPRRSPIRRKDKFRPEEGFRFRAKRNHKKILNKIKYDWQGE